MKTKITLALMLAGTSVLAAAGAPAAAEKYDIDSSHSGIIFGWNHFGFSNPSARFDTIEGSLQLDKSDITKSTVSVVLPLAGIDTGVPKLDEELKGPDFFDSAKFPAITFKSTKVEKVGDNGLKVTGNLTVHGVTKSVTLDGKVNKIAVFELPGVMKAPAAGFDATITIKRSDFGVTKYLPVVSDEIPVRITLDAKQLPAK
jgi:polyisoprenoid-binding protein YceI